MFLKQSILLTSLILAGCSWTYEDYMRTAKLEMAAKQDVQGIPHLQNAVQAASTDNERADAKSLLALVRLAQDPSDERSIHLALNDADAALRVPGHEARGRFMRGLALLRLGQSREADAEFGKAIDRAAEEKVPESLIAFMHSTRTVSRSSWEGR